MRSAFSTMKSVRGESAKKNGIVVIEVIEESCLVEQDAMAVESSDGTSETLAEHGEVLGSVFAFQHAQQILNFLVECEFV